VPRVFRDDGKTYARAEKDKIQVASCVPPTTYLARNERDSVLGYMPGYKEYMQGEAMHPDGGRYEEWHTVLHTAVCKGHVREGRKGRRLGQKGVARKNDTPALFPRATKAHRCPLPMTSTYCRVCGRQRRYTRQGDATRRRDKETKKIFPSLPPHR